MVIWNRIKTLDLRQFLILSGVFISKPLYINPTIKATKETVKVCDHLFHHRHHGHNRENAFRHALWTYLICSNCLKVSGSLERSKNWAKKITDLHEKLLPNEELEMFMDLHNNNVGLQLCSSGNEERNIIPLLQDMMKEAVLIKKIKEIENLDGKLVYIHPDILKNEGKIL